MTEKTVLTQEEYVNRMFDALTSGNATEISEISKLELAEEETEELESSEDNTGETDSLNPQDEDGSSGDDNQDTDESDGEEDKAPEQKDWRSALPDDIKDQVLGEFNKLQSQLQPLEHYRSSNEGRVSRLTKDIKELEAKLAKLQSAGSEPARAPATTAVEEKDPAFIEELKESDPALYQALKEYRHQLFSSVDERVSRKEKELDRRLQEVVSPIQARASEEQLLREAALVEQSVPFVRELVNAPEWDTFLNSVPESVVGLTQTGRAADFLAAIDMFGMWYARTYPDQAVPQTPAPAPAANPVVEKVQAQRQRKLQAGAPGTKPAPANVGQDLDEETALEAMFQNLYKKGGYKY